MTGQQLGDFEIGPRVGGPDAVACFRARQLSTGRDARIKILADQHHLNGHYEQIQNTRLLEHPNVASLFDVRAEDAILYAACEWVEGETLRQKLEKGRLPIQKAANYASQIAEGLAAAHRLGVVHSDLKPENIRITKEGKVKIIDFGLANFSEASEEIARFADYASPEQVRGEPETAASDIYSLGVILYEMLSGTRPFLRPTLAATTKAILSADPPHELPAGVTPALGRIVRHCLEKEPSERFASASDLGFALEAFWNLTLPHDKIRKVRRTRLTGAFLACAAVGCLGLGVGALIARRYLRPVAAGSLAFRRLTSSGHDSAPSASADGETMVYASDRDGVSRIWAMRLETGQESVLTGGPDRYPRVSPDGKSVLFIRQEAGLSNLYLVALAGGSEHKIMSGVQGADWLPGGGIVWLKVAHTGLRADSVLGTAGPAGQDARELARADKVVLAFPRSSPDASMIAAVAGPSEAVHTSLFVARMDGSGQQYVLAAPANAGSISGATWAPDSQNVIYLQSENRATGNVWAGGGAYVVRHNAKTGGAAVIGYSLQNARVVDRVGPGRMLADIGSRRENLEEVGLGRDSREARPLTSGEVSDQDPIYSRSGDSLFFSAFGGGQTAVWELIRKTGMTRRLLAGGSNDLEPFPYSDGKRVLWTSDREGGHFEIYGANILNPNPRPITHDGVDAEHASITPDDAWIVYNSSNPERMGVWKIRQTGLDDMRLAAGETRWPRVSPDGKFVVYTRDLGMGKRAVQVVTLEGKRVGGEIALDTRPGTIGSPVGRAEWMPGGRAVAYIGLDERGRTGVYAQDFSPAAGTSGSRRALGGFGVSRSTEGFAISPDGASLTMSELDQTTGIVEISNVLGLSQGRR